MTFGRFYFFAKSVLPVLNIFGIALESRKLMWS